MSLRFLVTAACSLFLTATPVLLSAQDSTRVRPDSSASADMHHMMSPWKEMNDFHKVLGATWHPAEKGNLVPLRVRAKELKAAAIAWANSKAPAMPESCGSESVRASIDKVARDSRGIVAMLEAEADDNWLRATLKGVHDAFETAEARCSGHR